ncbi:hypothetical protein OXX79_002337 [Metschnikowia pulcherrima]
MSKIVRSIKNVANGYSSTQVLVRNATSNDASGPTTYDMEMIAAATYNTQTEFLEIMDMLDRRLNDKGRNWRHVAKSLTVLDYLVRFGAEKCVLWSKDNLYIIKTLREFVHFDEAGADQGALIRVKAKELVALLRDDERLATERQLARSRRSERSQRPRPENGRNSDPYDADLQRALEMSRETAAQEQRRPSGDDDAELQAALKLSLEEEELRRLKRQQNENLLDLDDQSAQQQPQFYQPVQFVQPTQFFQPQQTFYQQYDMFGNPIQPTAGGFYQNYGQFGQPQTQSQPQSQPQIPQYTGFVGSPEQLTPLKTGSNNPFALSSDGQTHQPSQPQQTQSAGHFYTQPAAPQFKPQSEPQQHMQSPTQTQAQQQRPQLQQQPSKYNDTHELNTLLASGTGLDTFGNTGATRIPHQHTKTGTFINSSGTGYNNAISDHRVSSNATGNPFLNTGIGATAQNAPQQNPRLDAAHTGYGFGNSKEEPSLIDI